MREAVAEGGAGAGCQLSAHDCGWEQGKEREQLAAPRLRNSRASAFPMPLVDPVMTTRSGATGARHHRTMPYLCPPTPPPQIYNSMLK